MQFAGKNVFPLVKADSLFHGYFMDAEGNVYSNKAHSQRLAALNGSRTPSGRYYTLNGRAYRADRLIAMAKQLPSFVMETGQATTPVIVSAPAAPNNQPLPVGRTKSAAAAVKAKGFLLAHVGPTDRLVFGTDPVLHLTRSTAVEEATRVASLKPGTKVVLLQIIASVVAGGTQWE